MSVYLEEIQDFIEGNLEGAALDAFLLKMEQDMNLKTEVALRQEIQQVLMKNANSEEDIAKLDALLSEKRSSFLSGESTSIPTISIKKKSNIIKWLGGIALAASLIFAITLSGVFTSTNYGELPSMEEYATRSEHQDADFTEAAKAYNNKDYKKAIALLSTIQTKDGSDAMVDYYLGLSYIGIEDYKNAEIWLSKIAAGKSVYLADAQYYAGFVAYKKGDFATAKKYLIMVNSTNAHFNKASKLLDKIKNREQE